MRGRIFRCGGVIVLVLTALFAAASGLSYQAMRTAESRWEDLLVRIRATGQPLTYADIQATYPGTGTTTASGAVIVHEALSALGVVERQEDSDVLPLDSDCAYDVVRGIDRRCVPPTRKYAKTGQQVLGTLHRVHGVEQSRFGASGQRDHAEYERISMGSLSDYHRLMKLLAVDTAMRIVDANPTGAVNDIVRSIRMSEPLYAEPDLIAHLVGLRCDWQTCSNVQILLSAYELNDHDLTRLDSAWARHIQRDSPRIAVLGERARFMEQSEPEAMKEAGYWAWYSTYRGVCLNPFSWLPFRVKRAFIEDRTRALARFSPMVEASCSVDAGYAFAKHEHRPVSDAAGPCETLVPLLDHTVEVYARSVGLSRCVSVALAAERFRLQRGQFPDQAADLVPGFLTAIPKDPFDGQPLRYRRTDNGVVIYTIGDDKVDDGGHVAPQPGQRGDRASDFGSRLLDPDKRGLRFIESAKDASHE